MKAIRTTKRSSRAAVVQGCSYLLAGCLLAAAGCEGEVQSPTTAATTVTPANTEGTAPAESSAAPKVFFETPCGQQCDDPTVCTSSTCGQQCFRFQPVSENDPNAGGVCVPSTCSGSSGLPCEPGPSEGGGSSGGGSTGGPPDCHDYFSQPAGFEVFLYEHSDFGGRCWVVSGPVTRGWIETAGIPNDTISSYKTGVSARVQFFKHINLVEAYPRSGWNSWVTYVGDALNDQASGFIISTR